MHMFRLRKPIMSSSSYELCGTITPSIMLILIINMWGMSWWWINPFHSTNQTQKWEVINWWITTQLLKPNTTKYCTKVAHNLRVAFVHTMGKKRCWGRLCVFFWGHATNCLLHAPPACLKQVHEGGKVRHEDGTLSYCRSRDHPYLLPYLSEI